MIGIRDNRLCSCTDIEVKERKCHLKYVNNTNRDALLIEILLFTLISRKISQNLPVYPGKQMQSYPELCPLHVAPLTQGSELIILIPSEHILFLLQQHNLKMSNFKFIIKIHTLKTIVVVQAIEHILQDFRFVQRISIH